MTPTTSPAILTQTSRPSWRCEKIQPRHLGRLAVVYIRQSSPQQLLRHQESTQVQHNLKLRAEDLGWAPERILLVDDDQGQSGASADARTGFQRVVSEVTLDHVGIVLGVETSRLARSCDDWYPLLKVCALFGTLIGDLDGVYDPSQYNDRLLLGLKGTMSEAELHILKQRMNEGKLNKARRGALIFPVPLGYVRRPSGEVTLDPDEQVQSVVRVILRKFPELGTLNAVLRYLVKNHIQIPVRLREGPTKGDLEWHGPNRMTLQNLLKNPTYAGAYVYGRRAVNPRQKVAGRPSTGRTVVAPEDCAVFLKDRLPAYISWDEFEANQARLKANRAVAEEIGAARDGPALLSGLLVCGKCRARIPVQYHGGPPRHEYRCTRRLSDYGEDPCQSVAGHALDRYVTREVLKALEPASLELSLEAAQNVERERADLDRIWQQRLERAAYEADRSARQYRAVEPENRLVARQLEAEWEDTLTARGKLQDEYDRFRRSQPRILAPGERETIKRLAQDVPALWEAPTTTNADRKEIVRQVVDRVTVSVVESSERVKVKIHWAGGTQMEGEMIRPVARLEQLSYYPELVNRVRELVAQKRTCKEIAETLNGEGLRPPKRRDRFGPQGIKDLMDRLGLYYGRYHKNRSRNGLGEHEWWLRDLAQHLQMPPVTLFFWLKRGIVRARKTDGSSRARWGIWADGAEIERLKKRRAVPPGYWTRRRWVQEEKEV